MRGVPRLESVCFIGFRHLVRAADNGLLHFRNPVYVRHGRMKVAGVGQRLVEYINDLVNFVDAVRPAANFLRFFSHVSFSPKGWNISAESFSRGGETKYAPANSLL